MRCLLPLLTTVALAAADAPVETNVDATSGSAPVAPAAERLPALFAARRGPARAAALAERGVPAANEAAVAAALHWLKRHQSANGMWDVDAYPTNCTDTPKTEPGTANTSEAGDVGCTALALLAYLGAGHDHKLAGPHRTTIAKGIDWLLTSQKGDGLLGSRNYEHALATAALCEALALSRDASLKAPAQKAVDILLARQGKDGPRGLIGWDYTSPTPQRNDASVSGWAILALVSAEAAGLKTGKALEGAQSYVDRAWKDANPDPAAATTSFPYTWNAQTSETKSAPGTDNHDFAGMAAASTYLMGADRGRVDRSRMLTTLVAHVTATHVPSQHPCNLYYAHHASLTCALAGGDAWTRWRDTAVPALVAGQRSDAGCFAGSWDYVGTRFHGHQTGRLLSTALACLALEAPYRYALAAKAAKPRR